MPHSVQPEILVRDLAMLIWNIHSVLEIKLSNFAMLTHK
jgi:hypothetical protein